MIRKFCFVALALLGAGMLTVEPVAADTLGDEYAFVAEINGLRSANGMAPLAVDPSLTAVARNWASNMAGSGYISHRSDLSAGVPSSWVFLGENVGVGGDVASLHNAFVASPTHLENLVNPRFTHVGIGIVQVGSTMWVAQEFMQASAPAPARTVVKKSSRKRVRPCRTRRCRRARARHRR